MISGGSVRGSWGTSGSSFSSWGHVRFVRFRRQGRWLKQHHLLVIDRLITFAGRLLDRLHRDNLNVPTAVSDMAAMSQPLRRKCDADPLHSQHSGQELLSYAEFRPTGKVVDPHQQTA